MLEAACLHPDSKAQLKPCMARSRNLMYLLKPEALDPRVTAQGPGPRAESQTRIREPREARGKEK